MLASAILATVSTGLIIKFTVNTGADGWIPYQLLTCMGRGIGFQKPLVVPQAFLHAEEIPVGTAIMTFFQSFSGAVFISVSQNVFIAQLLSCLRRTAPELNASAILKFVPTKLESTVPAHFLQVQAAYGKAI